VNWLRTFASDGSKVIQRETAATGDSIDAFAAPPAILAEPADPA
jgi:hypothetical protein